MDAPTFVDLQREFKKAEDAIHDLGLDHPSEGVDTPAINELRYAGFHALRAIIARDNGNDEAHLEEIRRAIRHCQRATYDAYDSGIFFLLKQFSAFRSDYKTLQIGPVVPDYLVITKRMQEARDMLREARDAEESREDFYARVVGIWERLHDDMRTLTAAREELNKGLAGAISQSKRFWVVPALTVGGIVVGSAVTLLSRWLWVGGGGGP